MANAAKMEGCELEEFLTRFVAELIDPGEQKYIELQPVKNIEYEWSFKTQVMLTYNKSLSAVVQEKLGIVRGFGFKLE